MTFPSDNALCVSAMELDETVLADTQGKRTGWKYTSIGNLKKYFLIKFVFHLLNSSTLKTLEESRRFFWFLLIKIPFLFLSRF